MKSDLFAIQRSTHVTASVRRRQSIVRRCMIAGCLAAFSPLLMGADSGCISSHLPDMIVAQTSQNVSVSMSSDQGRVDGEVELFVDGMSQGTGQTVGGSFTFSNVQLSPGAHVLSGETRRMVDGTLVTGEITPRRINVRPDLSPQGRQEVMFDFQPIADTRLREIAVGTIGRTLSEAELDQFVSGVKARAREFFSKLYEPFNVVLVDQPTAAGGGVVTVTFEERDERIASNPYATTIAAPNPDAPDQLVEFLDNLVAGIPDYNNQRKTQSARVFMGVIKEALVDQNLLFSETGASPGDSLEERIRDLGVALGHLAVHEVGHTLGLVAQDNLVEETAAKNGIPVELALELAAQRGVPNPLPDLEGCYEGHGCPDVDDADRLADRFGGGYYIMDPGELAPLHTLLGFADEHSRAEKLPMFDVFSASYIAIIHPKGSTEQTLTKAVRAAMEAGVISAP
jgi:hypothetical protein